MARLSYSSIASLDGYVADEQGVFDWAAPSEQVHAFINDLERPIGTYLYGRRMYQVMRAWESAESFTGDSGDPGDSGDSAVMRDYAAIWQAAEKIVYSTSLTQVSSDRTRIERTFDPEQVRRLKASAGRDLSVGGPELAGVAIEAGLVDEWHLFLVPVVVGGGNRSLSGGLPGDRRIDLELLDQRRFDNGTVYLHYRTRD
jgi:dihydrofolate reductase